MIVAVELLKTFRKWRSYIGFIAIATVIPLVEFGFKADGGSTLRNFTRSLPPGFALPENLFNGYFVTQFIMNSLWLHIPFLVTLVAGDMLAGEATAGTFRLILTRPPSRTRIFAAKFAVTMLHTALLVLFLAALSLGLGLWLFGAGDLLAPGSPVAVIPAAEVPARLALAFALAIWSMWCVASLALLFSSFVENAVGPIVGSMALLIVFLLVSTIPLAFFENVKPYLFTTHFNVWRSAMKDPLPWDDIGRSAAVLGAYIAGFGGAAWMVVARKDVLS